MPKSPYDLTSVSRKIRGRLVVTASSELDVADIDLFYDCLVMRFALLQDLAGSHSTIVEHWGRTVLGLTAVDVELYSSDWKTLREIVTSPVFRNEHGACASGFKHLAQGRIHYKWILNSALELLEVTGNFAVVNQWIVFDSKINFRSLDLTTQCCTEYLDFERAYPEGEWPHLVVAQRCAKDLFGDFRITDYPFRPRHGNGATAEVQRRDADPWHKNRHFRVDGEIITYLRYRLSESEWRNSLYCPYRGLDRTSILVCVPKSMTKNRTISKEPTTLQFLQQDLFAALDDYFRERIADRVDLHDQERSRALALQGSADGSYATIDLSSASDSVSVRHIEHMFDGLPILYPLMATRSTHVLVQDKTLSIDQRIKVKKFAPMGSATCFPVECMVFTILCEAAVRLETGRRSRRYDYVVYGDDIVIKTRYATRLVELLDEFGFIVNSDKTFLDYDCQGHTFREACGIEAYDGEDITPLKLSRRLVSVTNNDSDHQAGQGVGLIDLLNRAYLWNYPCLHRWLNDCLRSHFWYRRLLRVDIANYRVFAADLAAERRPWIRLSVPFVITDWCHDTQWQAYGRRGILRSPYHRSEVKVNVAQTRRQIQYQDDNDLFTWFVNKESRTVADEITVDDTGVVTLRPRDLKWSKTWVPLIWGAPPATCLRPAGYGERS